VGVPEIEQSLVPRVSPVGRPGLAVQPVIAPPVLAGLLEAIAVPLFVVRELGVNAIAGAPSFTVMVKLAVPVPPVLDAVRV
jgi:hypothetical protein